MRQQPGASRVDSRTGTARDGAGGGEEGSGSGGGWVSAVKSVGRLVRALAAEERRWPGAAGRRLSCEVLSIPQADVERLKVRAATTCPQMHCVL